MPTVTVRFTFEVQVSLPFQNQYTVTIASHCGVHTHATHLIIEPNIPDMK
jgi:hypothetical protein